MLLNMNLDERLLIIAEIGVNHEGDPEKALALVDLAAKAGADAVKFQSYTPERFVSAADPARLDRARRYALNETTHHRIAKRAGDLGIAFLSTPVTEDVVPFLNGLCPAFKIASGDIDFEPVIRASAATGKPLILSTGLATLDEIDRAVEWVRDETGLVDLRDRLALMHCVSAYPTPMEQANVRSVPFLAERYGLRVGYSNHAIGDEACLAAVALGACIIEVHFTDCKEGRTFRDHTLSLDPEDLSVFVDKARRLRSALGNYDKVVQECEAGGRAALRKGVVAACCVEAGTVLAPEHLMYARPATEFWSSEFNTLIGRVLRKSLKSGEPIPRDAV